MSRRTVPSKLLRELEEVADKLFDEVRKDAGSFETGACIVNGRKLLLINTYQSTDERVAALAREIARIGADRLYLKPALREEIERWADNQPPAEPR